MHTIRGFAERANNPLEGAGSVKPGHAYTGLSVVYRHPETGARHVGWSGEAHGTFKGDVDPARSILQSAKPHDFGSGLMHPEYAIFSSPNKNNPDGEHDRHALHLRSAGADYLTWREGDRKPQ